MASLKDIAKGALPTLGNVLGGPFSNIAGAYQLGNLFGTNPFAAGVQNLQNAGKAIGNYGNQIGQAFQSSTSPQTAGTQADLSTLGALGSTSGGSGAATSPASGQVVFNGVTYPSVADPGYQAAVLAQYQKTNQPSFNQNYQGQNYTNFGDFNNAVRQAALTEHDNQLKSINQAYQNGLISFDERNSQIAQNRQNIQSQVTELQRQYQNNLGDLGTSHTNALSNVSGYFSNISPFAYQSQQGNYEADANKQYQQGVDNLNATKAQNDTSTQQALGALTQNQNDLNTARGQYVDQYGNQVAGLNQQTQGALDAAANQNIANNQGYNAYLTNLQGYQDQLANNAISYQNSLKTAAPTGVINPNYAAYNSTATQQNLGNILGGGTPASAGGGGTVAPQLGVTSNPQQQQGYNPQQVGVGSYLYGNSPAVAARF